MANEKCLNSVGVENYFPLVLTPAKLIKKI
jgi:hypothetical protein